MSDLQCLLWDVDGTMAETERDGHRVAFNLAFAQAGLAWAWDEQRYGQLLHITGGRERLLHFMQGRDDVPRDPMAQEEWAARLHQLKNQHYAALVEHGLIPARPGVLALMREARSVGLRQGIATTTSRSNVEALMGRLLGPQWASWFEVTLCGEDVRRKKPDPEVYQSALERLQVRAMQALALEDSAPGVVAARAAGLKVLCRPSHYFPAAPEQPGVFVWAAEQSLSLAQIQHCWASQEPQPWRC